MLNESNFIKSYYGSYKKGIFTKKNDISLHIYERHIEGKGAEYYSEELNEKYIDIQFEDVRCVEIKEIKDNQCLVIECIDKEYKSIFSGSKTMTIVFPDIECIEEVKQLVCDLRDKCNKEKIVREQQYNERKEKQMLAQKKYEEECNQYYNECYAFHISDNNNSYYELKREKLQFIGIYTDKDRNLNFVSIDGNKKQESNACISYDKIHYYEKAGSIHYTEKVNGSYTNFGGSFRGGSFSKSTATIAGLLFGPMGMAAGALFTHKPSQIDMTHLKKHI